MAIAIANLQPRRLSGTGWEVQADVSFSGTYPTGSGEQVNASQLGLAGITRVLSAQLLTTVATGTAVDAAGNVLGNQQGFLLKLNRAVGEAAGDAVNAGTVVRVTVVGW